LVLVLAGCGGVGSGDDDAGGRVTLTTMGFGLPDEHATARIDAFKAANKNVDVHVNEGDFDDQQFLAAVASGDVPDLVYMTRDKLGSYAARGAVRPVDDCLATRHVDVSQYRPTAMKQVTYDGKVYGLPEFSQVRLVVVNDSVARGAGVDPAGVSTSDWTALADLTKRLVRRDGDAVSRIGFDPKMPEFLPLWAKANGVDLVGADGRSVRLDDPATIEAVRYASDLVAAQGGWARFKAFRDGFDVFGAKNQYVTGQLGFMPIESWYLNTLADNSPDVAVTVLPFTDRQGRPITTAGGQVWAIPARAKHPEEACAFITTMTDAKTWVTAAKARKAALAKEGKPYGATFTANRVADEQIFDGIYDAPKGSVLDKGMRLGLSLQDKVFAWPANPAGAELLSAWESGVLRVLQGEQTPEQAMAQAQHEADAAIDRAGR
jgi:multiple sugar transport system substrate-binding protein